MNETRVAVLLDEMRYNFEAHAYHHPKVEKWFPDNLERRFRAQQAAMTLADDTELATVITWLLLERARQNAQHGPNGGNQVKTPLLWGAVAAEENGEVAKEICEHFVSVDPTNPTASVDALTRIINESVQAAAVYVAMAEDMLRLRAALEASARLDALEAAKRLEDSAPNA